jgi:hypothetical protein
VFPRPRQAVATGIDVPAGFDALTAGRRAASDPVAVWVDIRHALPDELRAKRARMVEEPRIERSPVHVQRHRLEAERPSPNHGRGRRPPPVPPVRRRRSSSCRWRFGRSGATSVSIPIRRSRPGLDQSSDSPTFRCGYRRQSRQTTRRPAFRNRTLAANPAMPAPMMATSWRAPLTGAAYRKKKGRRP